MSKKYPSHEMDRFNVRLPAGMRGDIAKRAEANGRSMNSEIVYMLQRCMEFDDGPDSAITVKNGENDSQTTIDISFKGKSSGSESATLVVDTDDFQNAMKDALYSLAIKKALLGAEGEQFDNFRKKMIEELQANQSNYGAGLLKDLVESMKKEIKK